MPTAASVGQLLITRVAHQRKERWASTKEVESHGREAAGSMAAAAAGGEREAAGTAVAAMGVAQQETMACRKRLPRDLSGFKLAEAGRDLTSAGGVEASRRQATTLRDTRSTRKSRVLRAGNSMEKRISQEAAAALMLEMTVLH